MLVSRAGAAAVGARGAVCGAAALEQASWGRSPRPARWQQALDFCTAHSPEAGWQRNKKMDSFLLETRMPATSHGCQSLQPVEGNQHQALNSAVTGQDSRMSFIPREPFFGTALRSSTLFAEPQLLLQMISLERNGKSRLIGNLGSEDIL